MPQRQRAVVTGLIFLLLVLWLGFAVHRSTRFAGSLWGGVLAISGASLMVVFSLGYVAVKRIPAFKRAATRRITPRTLLRWHVYTAIVGSILVLLHTGHKFNSSLGIALTTFMFAAVFSGYVGGVLLAEVSLELREKQELLSKLETAYNQAANELSRSRDPIVTFAASHRFFWRLLGGLLVPFRASGEAGLSPSYRALQLAESIADLEYTIKTHAIIKRRAARWLKIHIAASVAFYVLLALHVWSSVHFGLRWFD